MEKDKDRKVEMMKKIIWKEAKEKIIVIIELIGGEGSVHQKYQWKYIAMQVRQ